MTAAGRTLSTPPRVDRRHLLARTARIAAVAATLALATAGCGSSSGSGDSTSPGAAPAIETADPKIPVPASPDVAAGYVTIANVSSEADVLESVTTDAGGTAELHRSVSENGSEMMRPAGPIRIGGGDTLTLAPGAHHIMIMKPSRTLSEGDHVRIDLVFERAGKVTFDAPVVPAADVLGGGGTSGHPRGDDHSGGH